MTDIDYYRTKRIIPRLRGIAKEYPTHTIENIIRQLEAKIEYVENQRKTKKKSK